MSDGEGKVQTTNELRTTDVEREFRREPGASVPGEKRQLAGLHALGFCSFFYERMQVQL
jgi:hypothetical protein